jgi:uncharacterized NAD-dependent epimerase/dehydratase family protein
MRAVEHPLPSIQQVIDLTISCGKLTNPNIRCVGIAVNTKALDDATAKRTLDEIAAAYDLPTVDPIRNGVAPIVAKLQQEFDL